MRRAVDSAREARDDGEARLAQRACEIARQLDHRRAGIARTDHGDARVRSQREVAAKGQDRRCPVDLAQQGRIVRLIVEEVFGARAPHRIDFAFDTLARGRLIALPAAFADIGQGLQRRIRIAIARQELRIADRADAGASQQADACESLGLGQRHFLPPTFGSSPRISRAMLARWR